MLEKETAFRREIMGKVLVVTSGKGGVGKTTTSANIGAGLALKGKKVLLIDTDIGLRNLDVVMGLENRIVYDIVDLIEGRCKIKQALVKDKRNTNLSLLPAAQTREKTDITPEQIKSLIETLREDFDYIIMDCPAGIEQGFKNAIVAADEAIIVTTPEMSAVRDADRVIGLLEAEEIKKITLIVNRIKIEMVKQGNMLSVDDVLEILRIKLLGIVPDDESIVISTNKGEPLVYKGKSLATDSYKNIVGRILGEDIEFLDLDIGRGFLRKIRSIFGN
jgi:septum site-determining protein MinD